MKVDHEPTREQCEEAARKALEAESYFIEQFYGDPQIEEAVRRIDPRILEPYSHRRKRKRVVYFIQAKTGEIKIGVSTNLKHRFSQIKVHCPVKIKLIGAMHEEKLTEADVHRLFKKYKLKGEWYKPDQEIFDFIDKNGHRRHRR